MLPTRKADPFNDEFECDRCNEVYDIECSVRVGGRKGVLVCEGCDKVELVQSDCLDYLRSEVADNTFDTIITDPPYGIDFVGTGWDHDVPGPDFWREFLRVAKPGSMLLSFGGRRTYHRMTCAIEDGGWRIMDCLMWIYGTGKAPNYNFPSKMRGDSWVGYGTSLKPGYEPICLAMKPLEGTYCENAEAYGVAGLNIEGCRIGDGTDRTPGGKSGNKASGVLQDGFHQRRMERPTGGRWPTNLILSVSVAPMLQDKARFFYCPKASKKERANNKHPTIKPLALMRWLVRLTKPPGGGIVLDPFMGSGTTGVACLEEGRRFVGIEKSEDYMGIARHRVKEKA